MFFCLKLISEMVHDMMTELVINRNLCTIGMARSFPR